MVCLILNGMNYELAKQLEAAGFKQYGDNRAVDGAKIMIGHPDYTAEYYVPTLEELVEECGDGFVSVVGRNRKHWLASLSSVDGTTLIQIGFGDSPTEAVAKLWLALNKQ